MIEHVIHRVPVTALAFSENFLFAGEGPYLRIHRRHDHELLENRKIFSSQAIHGIAVHTDRIIVWGGRHVAVFQLCPGANHVSIQLDQTSSFEAIDWILDVSISPNSPDRRPKAALITAHNALLLLDLELAESPEPSWRELTSNSKCILYSAHLHWEAQEHILVASGTVFGEIVVWSCQLGGGDLSKSTLHHILSGHDGSIFGVQIFDDSSHGNEYRPARLLASCSDDRTIRIWDISSLPEMAKHPHAAADLTSARETGFGANVADILPDAAAGGRCIAQAWGHASRIWGVRFIASQPLDALPYLVSFGEDATYQFWRLESDHDRSDPGRYALAHLGATSVHSGKNIWSWALGQETGGNIIVAAGGADGSIVLEPKSLPFVPYTDYVQAWSIQDLAVVCPGTSSLGKPDKLRSYAFVAQSDVIVTTDAGNVVLLKQSQRGMAKGNYLEWVSNEPKLRGYSVVTSIPNLSIAFLAGIDGTVFIYDGSEMRQLVKSTGKTTALLASQTLSPKSGQLQVNLLVANVEAKTSLFLRFDVDSSSGRASTVNNVQQWQVAMPARFIATSSLAINPGREDGKCMLILGSRQGSMATYLLDSIADQNGVGASHHSYVLHQVHAEDAVTGFAWVPQGTGSGYVFSVGRDGTYAVHHLQHQTTAHHLRLLNQTSLHQGTTLEGIEVDMATNHVSVWGFRSKHFIVFDVTKEEELMSIDCGGANRSWKFEPAAGLQGGYLAWTKASSLCFTSRVHRPHQMGGGSHGREIKAVAVCPIRQTSGEFLFATGAEDTDIKIFAYQQSQDERPRFRCLRTLRKHNTGIQQLEWSSDGRYLFSSGGFEEFFVWRIETAPLIGIGVVCESTCPTDSALPDLRIMGFSIIPQESTDSFIISMVRSDSTVRVYRYTTSHEKQWRILMTGNYLTSCLTQCLHIQGKKPVSSLVTAGTDGHVTFWPLDDAKLNSDHPPADPDPLGWISRSRIHQNTIHCAKVHWINDSDCLLLTGGDDNAIGITHCHWTEEGKNRPRVETIIIPRAHTAAVTGLEIFKSDEATLMITTASIDQRIKVWEVTYNPEVPSIDTFIVRRKQNQSTAVADVSSLARLKDMPEDLSIIICGVGMDVWSHRVHEMETDTFA